MKQSKIIDTTKTYQEAAPAAGQDPIFPFLLYSGAGEICIILIFTQYNFLTRSTNHFDLVHISKPSDKPTNNEFGRYWLY